MSSNPTNSPRPTGRDLAAPNHHASHPGFSGASGVAAGLSFLFGRGHAAEAAMGLAELRTGAHLVDIGCGPGVAAQRANAAGAQVIGVDPAPVMLRLARARWRSRPGLDWRLGTAESLPVEDGWAQVVWSLSTVHHWADIDAGLREACRVLAPGGRLITLERRIADTGARGHASHGWTVDQAEAFASACRRHGLTRITSGVVENRSSLLFVAARRSAEP